MSRSPTLVNWRHCLVYCSSRTHNQMNNIQAVHTISITSQLIPLVIGVISSLLALQQIILSWIKHVRILGFFTSTDCNILTLEKIYKDWNEIDFKITFGPFGEEAQIIKLKKVPASVNEANQTESRAAADKTSTSRNGSKENRSIISVRQTLRPDVCATQM